MNDATKMSMYTENVKKIANYLFGKFYKLDQFDVYYGEDNQQIEQEMCLNKADRLYQFFNDPEEIKRMVNFLDTVNPGLAKELVNGL